MPNSAKVKPKKQEEKGTRARRSVRGSCGGAAETRRIKPAAPRALGACGAGDFYFFAMPASLV